MDEHVLVIFLELGLSLKFIDFLHEVAQLVIKLLITVLELAVFEVALRDSRLPFRVKSSLVD